MPAAMKNSAGPFAEVESWLQRPEADGAFVYYLTPDGPAANAGLRTGDIVVRIGEADVPALVDFYNAMRPASPEDTTRKVKVLRRGGTSASLEIPASLKGFEICQVRTSEPAWEEKPDFAEEPDFTALEDGTEHILRNSFGEEPAGFEWIKIARRGGKIEMDLSFRLGGLGGEGAKDTWEYFTRARSLHQMDRWLTTVKSAFWEGKPGAETVDKQVELEDDGVWRGRHKIAGAQEKRIEVPARVPSAINAYAVALLPLTMPLRVGASLTTCHMFDGSGAATCRQRMECTGRERIKTGGREVEAWSFAWRHYGTRSPDEDEKFFVTEDRKLIRMEWGPGYGNCWADALPKDRVFDGIPAHVMAGVR